MTAIVEEADLASCAVAAHAVDVKAAKMAVKAGVTTIEHTSNLDEECIRLMIEKKTIFLPTLAIAQLEAKANPDSKEVKSQWIKYKQNAYKAWSSGIRIAVGGDTGPYPHGENVTDMLCLLEAGLPMVDVLQAATLHGYEACGGIKTGDKFGWLGEGWKADLVALDEDPMKGGEGNGWGALWKVGFVMKDGKVWKDEGKEIA